MRQIEIDIDIHKMIEAERRSFEEPPNTVLRRLLKLPKKNCESDGKKSKNVGVKSGVVHTTAETVSKYDSRAWTGKGVTLPHGTELKMEYRGETFFGRIENGAWAVDGRRYSSPSDAAGSVATTKSGNHPSLNGWVYWNVKRPGDVAWLRIDQLRNG